MLLNLGLEEYIRCIIILQNHALPYYFTQYHTMLNLTQLLLTHDIQYFLPIWHHKS